jgi:hypothetical protein
MMGVVSLVLVGGLLFLTVAISWVTPRQSKITERDSSEEFPTVS